MAVLLPSLPSSILLEFMISFYVRFTGWPFPASKSQQASVVWLGDLYLQLGLPWVTHISSFLLSGIIWIYIYLKLSVFLMNLISTSTLHSSFSLYFRWHDHFTSEAGSPPGFLNIFLAIFSFRFPPPPTFHLYPHWICSPPFIWNMAFYFFCM